MGCEPFNISVKHPNNKTMLLPHILYWVMLLDVFNTLSFNLYLVSFGLFEACSVSWVSNDDNRNREVEFGKQQKDAAVDPHQGKV